MDVFRTRKMFLLFIAIVCWNVTFIHKSDGLRRWGVSISEVDRRMSQMMTYHSPLNALFNRNIMTRGPSFTKLGGAQVIRNSHSVPNRTDSKTVYNTDRHRSTLIRRMSRVPNAVGHYPVVDKNVIRGKPNVLRHRPYSDRNAGRSTVIRNHHHRKHESTKLEKNFFQTRERTSERGVVLSRAKQHSTYTERAINRNIILHNPSKAKLILKDFYPKDVEEDDVLNKLLRPVVHSTGSVRPSPGKTFHRPEIETAQSSGVGNFDYPTNHVADAIEVKEARVPSLINAADNVASIPEKTFHDLEIGSAQSSGIGKFHYPTTHVADANELQEERVPSLINAADNVASIPEKTGGSVKKNSSHARQVGSKAFNDWLHYVMNRTVHSKNNSIPLSSKMLHPEQVKTAQSPENSNFDFQANHTVHDNAALGARASDVIKAADNVTETSVDNGELLQRNSSLVRHLGILPFSDLLHYLLHRTFDSKDTSRHSSHKMFQTKQAQNVKSLEESNFQSETNHPANNNASREAKGSSNNVTNIRETSLDFVKKNNSVVRHFSNSSLNDTADYDDMSASNKSEASVFGIRKGIKQLKNLKDLKNLKSILKKGKNKKERNEAYKTHGSFSNNKLTPFRKPTRKNNAHDRFVFQHSENTTITFSNTRGGKNSTKTSKVVKVFKTTSPNFRNVTSNDSAGGEQKLRYNDPSIEFNSHHTKGSSEDRTSTKSSAPTSKTENASIIDDSESNSANTAKETNGFRFDSTSRANFKNNSTDITQQTSEFRFDSASNFSMVNPSFKGNTGVPMRFQMDDKSPEIEIQTDWNGTRVHVVPAAISTLAGPEPIPTQSELSSRFENDGQPSFQGKLRPNSRYGDKQQMTRFPAYQRDTYVNEENVDSPEGREASSDDDHQNTDTNNRQNSDTNGHHFYEGSNHRNSDSINPKNSASNHHQTLLDSVNHEFSDTNRHQGPDSGQHSSQMLGSNDHQISHFSSHQNPNSNDQKNDFSSQENSKSSYGHSVTSGRNNTNTNSTGPEPQVLVIHTVLEPPEPYYLFRDNDFPPYYHDDYDHYSHHPGEDYHHNYPYSSSHYQHYDHHYNNIDPYDDYRPRYDHYHHHYDNFSPPAHRYKLKPYFYYYPVDMDDPHTNYQAHLNNFYSNFMRYAYGHYPSQNYYEQMHHPTW